MVTRALLHKHEVQLAKVAVYFLYLYNIGEMY